MLLSQLPETVAIRASHYHRKTQELYDSMARQEQLVRRMQYAAAVLQAEFDEQFDEWDQVNSAAEGEAPPPAGGRDQVLVHLQRLVALHANPPPPRVVARGQ